MYMKTITLALTFAALVAAAPVPEGEDIIIHPSIEMEDTIDITPEQYKAELSQMLLNELPEGVSINDIVMMAKDQDMSIEEINAIEEASVKDDIEEYQAELQEMLDMAMENSIMDNFVEAENSLAAENSFVEDAEPFLEMMTL